MTIKLDLDSPSDEITFDAIVHVPTPNGQPVLLPLTFRYRNREEVAELFDDFIARDRARSADREREAASEKIGAAPPEEKTLKQYAIEATARDVEATMKIANAWDVQDREFGPEQLAKFFRRYPGAYAAIVTHWRLSLTEGRLGNSVT